MVRSIVFNEYFNFKNQSLYLHEGVNLIFGTPETLTALLYLLRRCFNRVHARQAGIKSQQSLEMIYAISRFSQSHELAESTLQNPAAEAHRGKLFTVQYTDGKKMAFRRLRIKAERGWRYAVKPVYAPGHSPAAVFLPTYPVLYLSNWQHSNPAENQEKANYQKVHAQNKKKQVLENLFLTQVYQNLPAKFQATVANIYASFTDHKLGFQCEKKIKLVCTPLGSGQAPSLGQGAEPEKSRKNNLPLNTSLFCLLIGLVTLKWFHKTSSQPHSRSILLLDSLDQYLDDEQLCRFLHVCNTYAEVFDIQIIATCTRMELFGSSFTHKCHALCLTHDERMHLVERPPYYKASFAKALPTVGLPPDVKIPVFMEDKESRLVMEIILAYFASLHAEFRNIKEVFHLVPSSMGANNLRILFADEYLIKTTMQSICILDGDCRAEVENNILVLPGNNSPEGVIIDYVQALYLQKSPFWNSPTLANSAYSIKFYEQNILPTLTASRCELCLRKKNALPVSGRMTATNKRIYSLHKQFFTIALHYWVSDAANRECMNALYHDLNILFKKIAPFYGVDPKLWP